MPLWSLVRAAVSICPSAHCETQYLNLFPGTFWRAMKGYIILNQILDLRLMQVFNILHTRQPPSIKAKAQV